MSGPHIPTLMDKRATTQPPLPRKLWLIAMGCFVAAVAIFLAFVWWGIFIVDQQAIAKQKTFLEEGLEEAFAELPTQQESSTIWDDAVAETRANNQAWMEENLGAWMHSYFGHDRVYILDETDRPIHAMVDGLTRATEVYRSDAPVIEPLVVEMRTSMAQATRGLADATEAVTEIGIEDFRQFGERLALVSVKAIVPSTDNMSLAPGSEYLHIAVQDIDGTFLAEIGSRYHLDGVRLTAPEAEPNAHLIPLRDRAGNLLAQVAWEPDKPGLQLAMVVAPGFVIAVSLGLALIFYLVHRAGSAWRELKASEAQALFLAFHDTLTGLPNRALFDDRLDRCLARARLNRGSVALHTVDLDGFKIINDTMGHPAGDELIRQVARRLSGIFREADTVARLGGDEFAVLQPDILLGGAEQSARRIVDTLAEPFDLHGEKAFVSASVGIALSSDGSGSRDELLRRADIALYEAKARGRGRYQIFEGGMDDLVRRRREIEQDLRTALEAGDQLRLVYQPVFARDGASIVGAEALVRWAHPRQGWLAPDLFISTAEERGLIDELGDWVLREAAKFAVCTSLPWVAVNVSPVQLRKADFASRVLRIAREAGLEPTRLQLEITEGVLLENPAQTDATLRDLRNAGIHIALDDFGTGYSSLSYLRRYAVDKLKIDRSYVAELGNSPDAEAIISSVVALARSLHLKVTAEGVETSGQQAAVVAIGCDELQGFGLSKPIAALELQHLLAVPRVQRMVVNA